MKVGGGRDTGMCIDRSQKTGAGVGWGWGDNASSIDFLKLFALPAALMGLRSDIFILDRCCNHLSENHTHVDKQVDLRNTAVACTIQYVEINATTVTCEL